MARSLMSLAPQGSVKVTASILRLPLMSALRKPEARPERPLWARSSRDLIWPKAEGPLPGVPLSICSRFRAVSLSQLKSAPG
jgi:hypothetical protein